VILITGASGFIGGAITARLIERTMIRGLTGHPDRSRFGDRVRSFLCDFDNPARMAPAFEGVEVFVNTNYVRFPHGGETFERAVDRSRLLFAAARQAGVRKIVHVSVSNASEASDLPFYRNKARIERLVRESGLEHTILQPAIIVGAGDILINNIAFFLRRLPMFTIFGDGSYRLQPITVNAFADVAVEAIGGAYPSETVALASPRDLTFVDLVRAVRTAVGSRAAIVPAPAWVALAGLKVAGLMLGDVVLTDDEIRGLTREYLDSAAPHRRGVDFAEWLGDRRVASELGKYYASELARHFDRAPTRS